MNKIYSALLSVIFVSACGGGGGGGGGGGSTPPPPPPHEVITKIIVNSDKNLFIKQLYDKNLNYIYAMC